MTEEVLGGTWDALATHRADLAVGANGEPPTAGYSVRQLGAVDFVFVVAPHHPLATAGEPIPLDLLTGHRRVALSDTSRSLPSRNLGLVPGEDVLTVPTSQAKLAAQIAGLGIGHVPRHLAQPHLAAGTLVEKRLDEPPPATAVSLAWRAKARGRALLWWVDRLQHTEYPALVRRDG